jgi:hypothetical protein
MRALLLTVEALAGVSMALLALLLQYALRRFRPQGMRSRSTFCVDSGNMWHERRRRPAFLSRSL